MSDDEEVETLDEDDVEEGDEIEPEVEEPEDFWKKKQKELVTSTVDYNLLSLANLIDSKTIDLSPKYQRRLRWDEVRQSRLMESFLLNVPVPPIFLNEDDVGVYSVIDGKQRLLAIHSFMKGELTLQGMKVFKELNNYKFPDLPDKLQSAFKTRSNLRAIIILNESDKDVKYEVFQRLNTGGVQLNSQEIRNSAYPGPLNDALISLSEDSRFRKMLMIKDPKKSKIYQYMRDAELVLRFFTFKDRWIGFHGSMSRAMDDYMLTNQRMFSTQIEKESQDFLMTLQKVEAAFGDNAFKRWDNENKRWKQRIVATVFDSQMFSCRHFLIEELRANREEITEGMIGLFKNIDYLDTLRSFNTAAFESRTQLVIDMIASIVE